MKDGTLDEIDIKIIKVLIENSRSSAREISKKLNISPATVINRIKNLEKLNIIKGFSVVLNHEKLGYELTAIIDVRISQGKLREIENLLSKIPNVCAVYDVTGEYDAIIIAKFKNRQELSDFIKNLLSIQYVERTNTHVVLTTVKEDFNSIIK